MTPMRWMWLSLGVTLVALAWAWASMPSDPVPVHFGWRGDPDAYGTRTELVGVVGAVMLATWAFMAWLVHAADRLDWSMVNIARKDHWQRPENAPVARERLRVDMTITGVWTMALFVGMLPLTVIGVRHGELPTWSMWGMLGFVAAWTAVLLVVMVRRVRFYREVDGDDT